MLDFFSFIQKAIFKFKIIHVILYLNNKWVIQMKFSKKDTIILKGVIICFMIFHHAFGFPNRIQDGISYFSTFKLFGNNISYYIGDFGQICIASFLFLGGFGTYLSSKSKDILPLIKGKLVKLYSIFWKVFFIVIPISLILHVDNIYPFNFKGFILNFLGLNTTYNAEWWFLTTYVLLLFMFPILKKWIDRKHSSLIKDLIYIALFNEFVNFFYYRVIYNFQSIYNSVIFNKLYDSLFYLAPFFVGCLFAKYDLLSYFKKKISNKTGPILLSILAFLVSFYLRYKYGNIHDFVYAPITIITFIGLLSLKKLSFLNSILEEIGKYSTYIWLTHTFYCYLWCQEFIFFPKYSILIFLLLLFISYTTGVFIEALYNKLGDVIPIISKKKKYSK